jgi:hypothetical protein
LPAVAYIISLTPSVHLLRVLADCEAPVASLQPGNIARYWSLYGASV